MTPRLTEPLVRAVNERGGQASAIGFLAQPSAGRHLLVEPAGHFDGVSWTIPKVQRAPNESPADALSRCISHKLGVSKVHSVMPIPGAWTSSKGEAVYFTGRTGEIDDQPDPSRVTDVVALTGPDLEKRLAKSSNAASRQRDLEVFRAALGVEVVPHRVVMRALVALHDRGFQRLRGLHWNNGIELRMTWEPQFAAGSASVESWQREIERAGVPRQHRCHSAAAQQEYFGWPDAVFDNPEALAQRWLERVPHVAWSAFGQDRAYAEWYQSAVESTAPDGYYIAWDDGSGLHTDADVLLRDPPPPNERL